MIVNLGSHQFHICRTSTHLKHKYNTRENQRQLDIDLNDFFIRAEDYVWDDVLPKEGIVKYPWIDFSKEDRPYKHSVDNNQTFGPLRR